MPISVQARILSSNWKLRVPPGLNGSLRSIRRPGDRSRRARKLAELFENLKDRGIKMTVTGAHGQVRDLLRAERLDGEIQGIARGGSLESELRACSDVIQPT